MSLADINEELHRRSQPSDAADGKAVPPAPSFSVSLKPATSEETPDVPLGEAWGGQEKREELISSDETYHRPLLRIPKKVALLLGGVALAAIMAGVFFKAGGWLFAPENVQVTITGPKEVDSNQLVEYTVSYENNNWIDLENAELVITYPPMFRFVAENGFETNGSRAVLPLGIVKESSLSSVRIKGSFQSLQDQVALITATLRAAPSGTSSRIDFENRYSIAVGGSSLVIEMIAPLQAGDGQYADYVVTYRNESAVTLQNLELRMNYPDGFEFEESTPRPTRDEKIWVIPALVPGESGMVTVRGTITGAQGDIKRVIAELGVPQGDGTLFSFANIVRQTRIIASPLVISQQIGNDRKIVRPGDSIGYRILFRNDGDVGLRDLIVTVDLDPKYFDISEIELTGGTYSTQKKQAIFRASDRNVLALLGPGQGGELSFSVPIRSDLESYNQSNIEIESIAKIDSPDVPTPIGANKIIASDRIAFKVATIPIFELNGYHFDGYGNTGPIPPTVGQETLYTLYFRIASTINALENVRADMSLPGYVRYIKTQSVSQGAVTYNDRTGEIFWNVGSVPPGPQRATELSIQVGITPDPSQVDEEPIIVNKSIFFGKDIWTGEELRRDLQAKTINFQEDRQLTELNGGKVRGN